MNYELVKILKDGEDFIYGEETLKRAKELGIISGKKEADYLIEHQEEIPGEWRDYYLVFPNYLLDDRRDRRVAYFNWDGQRWALVFRWLRDGFDGSDRFVCSRESLETKELGTSKALEILEEIENKIEELKNNL